MSAPGATPVGAMASVHAAAISPVPTDAEAAAIVAALELAWPRPVLLPPPVAPVAGASHWRWAGRWWARRPHAADRRRP